MEKLIKVLIVDDERHNVKIMQEMLSYHQEYETKKASSGEEALLILQSYFPEIILLDVIMSGIDGLEVCRRIRSIPEQRFSKIIMVSGMSTIDDRLKGYEAGADDYLTKPFDEAELLAKLKVYSKLNHMEEVDSVKTTAMNILRHEIRTPLNGIFMASELLGEITGLSKQARTYLEMVRTSGLRIEKLVDKISRYFTIKDGIVKNISNNSLKTVLHNIINGIAGKSGGEVPKIICKVDENISINADWPLLEEAISYVLDNAVKNTPSSGVVSVICSEKFSNFFIEISDEGQGLDPKLSKLMFDGLFLPDYLHIKNGTGLNLAIAKEIIEDHGGRISCKNRDSGGTIFKITIKDQNIIPIR